MFRCSSAIIFIGADDIRCAVIFARNTDEARRRDGALSGPMTEQHQDASKEGQPRDVVAAAVNIARAAQRAHSQASAASRKVDFIEELARRARDEADSLHDVASQLTATATSVAIIALETCRTDDERERLRQEVAATSDVPSANDAAIDNFDSILSSLQIGHQLALPAESATGRHQQQPDGRDHTKNIERNKDTDTPSVSQQQDKSSVFIEQATPSLTTTKAFALVIQHAKEDAALESLRGCLKKSSDMLLDIDEVNTTVTGDKSSRHRKVGFESENSETDALTAELTKKEQQRRKLKPISLCKASVEPGTDSGVEATVGGFSPTLRGGAFSWVDNDCRQEVSDTQRQSSLVTTCVGIHPFRLQPKLHDIPQLLLFATLPELLTHISST